MKKILALALALILICPAALAGVDLTALSFDELAALRDQAQLEMMKRKEWQEVTVPRVFTRWACTFRPAPGPCAVKPDISLRSNGALSWKRTGRKLT